MGSTNIPIAPRSLAGAAPDDSDNSRARRPASSRVPARSSARIAFLLAAACCGALAAAGQAQGQVTRILLLGDSITESYTGYASYRYWLWQSLLAQSYAVDFVGSMQGVYAGPPLYGDFDLDHEGHWGWRVDEVLIYLADWALSAAPDIALVHLGHNDLWQGQGIPGTIAEFDVVIDVLRSANPAIVVLLAQVIAAAPGIGLDEIPAFNAEIAALAASKTTPAAPVVAVDLHTGFDPAVDTWDGVHPDESGEQHMTARWLAALGPFLGTVAQSFERGDCNQDGGLNIADAIVMLAVLFEGSAASCADACDANDDGTADIADPISWLAHLFNAGAPPPAPFGACGVDGSPDALACMAFGACP